MRTKKLSYLVMIIVETVLTSYKPEWGFPKNSGFNVACINICSVFIHCGSHFQFFQTNLFNTRCFCHFNNNLFNFLPLEVPINTF